MISIGKFALASLLGSILTVHVTSQSEAPRLVSCNSLTGSTGAVGSASGKWIDEILTVARLRTEALKKRDAKTLERLLRADFVYTNASGKVFDRAAYIRSYATDRSVEWVSQTLSDVCIRFASDTAVLTASMHDVARFGDYALNTKFRTTQIYRRISSDWIYIAGHTSAIE